MRLLLNGEFFLSLEKEGIGIYQGKNIPNGKKSLGKCPVAEACLECQGTARTHCSYSMCGTGNDILREAQAGRDR